MSQIGLNDPCPCGSGRKTKRCCGIQRGPSGEQLARAALARCGREAAAELAGISKAEFRDLWERLSDLPGRDLSLQARLPQLISPDLQRLRQAIAADDPDWGWDALTAVVAEIDTPEERLRLATALVGLRDTGRLDRRQAAAALLDLGTSSTRFIGAALLEAVAVAVGVSRTPAGLRIAA